MTKKQKKNLLRIVYALLGFGLLLLLNLILEKAAPDRFPAGLASVIPGDLGFLLPFVLFFALYLYIGHDVLRKCFLNIKNGQVMDENFLMTVATVGAFGLGIFTGITEHRPEGFDEACGVLIFYQIGEWFQSYAVGRSRRSIAALMDIRPETANLLDADGTFRTVDPSEVAVGSEILVKPGEKIPLDGVILSGNSTLDTKALTGESRPRDVGVGDAVVSGSVNMTSTLTVRTGCAYEHSTVKKILDLVENATSKKSKSETFITKFSRVYTPAVVFASLALLIFAPIISYAVSGEAMVATWLYRALSFLVVSCPCALVISIPLSFFAGIGSASAEGILIKGSVYLEQFDRANVFVFDKTGTLTRGNFSVVAAEPEDRRDDILRYAAIAEGQSDHPIAKSILAAVGKTPEVPERVENFAGKGIRAESDGHTILCGNARLMDDWQIAHPTDSSAKTVVYVALDGAYLGRIFIADEVKPEAADALAELRRGGAKTVMLTGDNAETAAEVAKTLSLDAYRAALLPDGKVREVERLLSEKQADDVLCFVGDGINDAPVLMQSDIGISMGGVGSDAAIEASDIVLMNDDLRALPRAKRLARKVMRIVCENIVFAIAVKLLILVLSACGIGSMWTAVFGDVGVAVIAILNAMRAKLRKETPAA